jgi:hypothetical protein
MYCHRSCRVEFDHLAVEKQVQGMFLCFNFPLRLIGASSLSGCYVFPFL